MPRTPSLNSAQRSARLLWSSLAAVMVLLFAAAPASAQQSADSRLDVTISTPSDARPGVVTVRVAGLADFADGTLAVYQCGNATSSGRPMAPAEADCAAPGTDAYLTRAIDGDAVTVRFEIARNGIGTNAARCIPALDGAPACQLVIGAIDGTDAEIIGVPLDDALAELDALAGAEEGATAADQGPLGELPVTGLGTRGIALALFVAALLFYLGSLLRSATEPA